MLYKRDQIQRQGTAKESTWLPLQCEFEYLFEVENLAEDKKARAPQKYSIGISRQRELSTRNLLGQKYSSEYSE